MSEQIDAIDELQENGDCYVVDFLPKVMDKNYFKLEKYMLKHFLSEFSQKIVFIVFKLISYYPAKIYLTELPVAYNGLLKKYPIEKNIRAYSLDKLAKIIEYVIRKDKSSVQILIKGSCLFNISVNGLFSVSIHGLSKDDDEWAIVNSIVCQEGLFLREARRGKRQ